jgi:hypothetical protein
MQRSDSPTPSRRRRSAALPGDLGAPMLLLVSVAAVGFSVAAIVLVALTGAGWAVMTAMTATLVATSVIIAFIAKMLADAEGTAG